MKAYFIGAKGGTVAFVSRLTGEARGPVPLNPGVYPLAYFARFRGNTEEIEVTGGSWLSTQGNTETCKPVGQWESAANPSFSVTPAARQLRQMRELMNRTAALANRAAKSERAMRRAKAAPPPAQLAAPVDEAVLPDASA